MSDDTTQLLELLHRGGGANYWWRLADKSSAWYEGPATDLPEGADVYWNVHPCAAIPARGDPTHARGKVEELAAVTCLFAEFDAKDFGGSMNAVNTHVENIAPRPSALVNSGHGFHAYWLYETPTILNGPETRADAARRQAAWVTYVGGDGGAKDLARILRVPGTVNAKREPVPVTLVYLTDDAYTPEEFDKLLEEAPSAPSIAGDTDDGGLPIPEGRRNARLTSLGGTLARRGMTEAAVRAALLAENTERCQPPLSVAEVEVIARSVMRYDPKREAVPTTSTWKTHAATLTRVEWTWPDWLPNGFVSLLAAQSEIGKSSLAQAIAGALTDGRRLPDLTFPPVLGNVVWVDTEASQVLNYTRAEAWGIDMAKFIVPTLDGTMDDIDLRTPAGWASLEHAAHLDGVVMIVIDSLGGAVSVENTEEMKDVVRRLAILARDTGKPLLLIHHPRKLAQGEPDEMTLDRVRGSSGIVQFCRMIWTIETPNPFEEDTKRLRVLKSNLGKKPKPIGFRITDDGITFGAAPERPEENTKLTQAEMMIRELLKDGKPKLASVFLETAAGKNINEKTLQRAKKSLGVVSEHAPDGKAWVWRMPKKPTG